MTSFTNQEVIQSIKNGEEDILFYLTKKYFNSAGRWLRRSGCRDSETPAIFGRVMVNVFGEIQRNNISSNVDFEQFFTNSLREYFKILKTENPDERELNTSEEKEIIRSCFSILDESSRKILAARYSEKLSFEQIAARMDFSNPVIAQFEFNKAFSQFEKISRARLNVASE